MKWTAIAHPGLEKVVEAELREHGFQTTMEPGAVTFEGDPGKVRGALALLRTPDRVMLEIAEGRFPNSDGLAALVRAQKWKDLVTPEATIDVDVHGHGAGLRFKASIEKRVAWAIQEALKGPRIPERYGRPRLTQRVSIRAVGDRATISLDAGGDLLYRRGWRTDVSKAPIRENIAAALIRLSGWSPDAPLLDPFCGSGTIPIEAALLAAGRSPFVKTMLALEEWPMFRGQKLTAPKTRSYAPQIYGSDRDPKVIAAAQANAKRAGVNPRLDVVEITERGAPADRGFIVTNPPWGHRLNGEAGGRIIPATDIFIRFGTTVLERFPGWRVVFLAPELELARRVSPKVQALATFPNGGVRVTVWAVG